MKKAILTILILFLLCTDALAAEKGVVKGGSLRIRREPNENAEIIGTLENRTELIIVDKRNGWLQVNAPALRGGWVNEKYVTISGKTSPHGFDPDEEQKHRDIGTPATLNGSLGNCRWEIQFPFLSIDTADDEIQNIITQQIRSLCADNNLFEQESLIRTLHMSYSSYLATDRYQGVVLFGYVTDEKSEVKTKNNKKSSSKPARQNEFIFSLNIDTLNGTVLKGNELYKLTDAAYTHIENMFRQDYIMELAGNIPERDPNWLNASVLTPAGVAVYVPKGNTVPEELGAHKVVIAYQELSGMLNADTYEAERKTVVRDDHLFYPIPENIDPAKPMVALTFDDGPSAVTEKLLKILADNGCHATFCVVGSRINEYPSVVKHIAEQGHEIACHTWSHKRLDNLEGEKITSQLKRTIDAVYDLTGYRITALRPPYGITTKASSKACIEQGLTVYSWDLDTDDWSTKNTQKTIKAVQNNVKNGSIILCHDIYDETVEAVAEFIPWLIENGYQVCSVNEMMAFRSGGMALGSTYIHLNEEYISSEPWKDE